MTPCTAELAWRLMKEGRALASIAAAFSCTTRELDLAVWEWRDRATYRIPRRTL